MAYDEVRNVGAMRCLGVLLILLSIAEFGVGGAIFSYIINVHLGSWWAAICTFIAGILALYSYSHCAVVTGCIFSILGVLSAAAGAIYDGFASNIFNRETGCVNINTGKAWGTQSAQRDALTCAYQLAGYENANFYHFDDNKYDCVCTDNTLCYGYDISYGNDCGMILTTYTYLLCISTAICVVLTLICFIYSVFTCVSCCCNHHPAPHPPVHELHPHGHYYSKTHTTYV